MMTIVGRKWRLICAALVMMMAIVTGGVPLQAQSVLATAWVRAERQPGPELVLYSHRELSDGVSLLEYQGQDSDFVVSIIKRFEGMCRGISSTPFETRWGGKLIIASSALGDGHCSVGVYSDGRKAYLALVAKQAGQPFSTDAAVVNWLSQYSNLADTGPSVVAASSEPSAIPSADTKISLERALDIVPKANRPIALVMRRELRFSNGLSTIWFAPWLIFANGYATDGDCYDWDPAFVSPTPEGLAAAGFDCTVSRWRKVGENYQFQDDDGSWDDPEERTVFSAVPRGRMFDAELKTEGGTGSTPNMYGASVINIIWSGKLKMTRAGQINVGNWRGTWLKGDLLDKSRKASDMVGQYLIEGHIIAIKDADGNVSRGFISISEKAGRVDYIYLNGELYWEEDK